jgi:hypothetical protein
MDRSLVTNIPCAPPCWWNITPGITTRTQVLQTLPAMPFFKAGSIRTPETETAIYWNSDGSSLDERILIQQNTVALIQVHLVSRNVQLEDVIRSQGEPDSYTVYRNVEHESTAWDFAFTQRGLIVAGTGGAPNNDNTVEIDPHIRITSAWYFPPMDLRRLDTDILGFTADGAERKAQAKRPWPGLGVKVKIPN